MSDIVLRAEHVSKQYRLGEITGNTLREDLNALMSRFGKKKDKIGSDRYASGRKFYALKDVSFDVEQGSAIALVGRNGAGKSTLLKLISRITTPTEGRIRYKGNVASLLEVGTGFNQHLTGRENIYLNGAIMGLTRKDIDRRLEEIIEFSEIGPFVDTPVKRYSSGMYVKLGFAVAAHLAPDILICDEVLAVGDSRFQEKCIRKMSELAGEHTVIYVSHNMHTLRQLCTSALYLEEGRLTYAGELEKAIALYSGAAQMQDTHVDLSQMKHERNAGRLASMECLDILDTVSCEYPMYSDMKFRLKLQAHEDVSNLRVSVLLSRPGTGTVASSMSAPVYSAKAGSGDELTLTLPLGGLGPGEYDAELWLCFIDPIGRMVSYDVVPHAFRFAVTQNQTANDGMLWNEKRHGLMRLPDVRL